MEEFSKELLQFFSDHAETDVSQLAFKPISFPGFSKQEILQQLKGRQKSRKKFPFLKDHPQYKFPVGISLEQASSESTASFKGQLISGERFADLTGGMGVDTFFLGQGFKEVHYVDPNEELVKLAKWNFGVLGMHQVEVHHATASAFLDKLKDKLDWIYIDPSRRQGSSRVIALENYQPDIVKQWSRIRQSANGVMVKFSPMQDLKEIKQKLSGLRKIWILSIKHDLKEIVVAFGEDQPKEVEIEIYNDDGEGFAKLWQGVLGERPKSIAVGMPETYIYEPATGILKGGAQDTVAVQFGLKKLHANSNLYTHNNLIPNYPGRIFKYKGLEKFQKKLLGKWIEDSAAHVIVRNFPQGAEAIKKKLGTKESGNIYLLATTLMDDSKRIIICERLSVKNQ